jgi:hypothetical protein
VNEAVAFGLSAPLITMAVAILRRLFPVIDGMWVPRLVVALTAAWGGVLILDGHFTGGVAEFVIAVAAVSAASIGINRLDKVSHDDAVAVTVERDADDEEDD